MVSILPSDARTGFDVLTRNVGQGMQNAMPQMYENQKRQMGLNAIDQLQASLNPSAGKEPSRGEVLANLARVMTLNPGFERSPYAEYVMKMAGAKAAQELPLPGGQPPVAREPLPPISPRGEEVNFLNRPQKQELQNFPSAMGPQDAAGNVPQAATSGRKEPLLTPTQMRKNAVARSRASTNSEYPITPQEAYQDEIQENEQRKLHNTAVDTETIQRKAGQKEYGAKASQALQKAYPGASDKMLALSKKWGEEAALQGQSESDIEDYVISKANNLANSISNLKTSLSRPDAFDKIERGMNGSYRDFEKSSQDLRNHLKPLLDLGLYDDARGILQGLDYGPEEREMIINPLSLRGQTILNSLPNMKGTKMFRKVTKAPEGTKDNVMETLLELKKDDPNFSPLLARKYAEDRGYDWNTFKDAWNELLQIDSQMPENMKNFKLSDDQRTMSGHLDTPPLDILGKILHTLDIRGR